jgi:hypothetical protein
MTTIEVPAPFDPADSVIVREPERPEPGYWVGCPSGYELFLYYVDPADERWRIDTVTAARPEDFDVATRRPALTANSTTTEGVKDPVMVEIAGSVHLFASYAAAAPRRRPRTATRACSSAEVDVGLAAIHAEVGERLIAGGQRRRNVFVTAQSIMPWKVVDASGAVELIHRIRPSSSLMT